MPTVVFTNGCFDILHPGHVDLLERAKSLGDKLIVGINSDRSVRAIKGEGKPFNDQEDRRKVLLGLRSVDEVVIFDELTPETLIENIKPDVLVKGGDWRPDEIIGSDFVARNGGTVLSLPLLKDHSSSGIVEKIRDYKVKSDDVTDSTKVEPFKEHLDTFNRLSTESIAAIRECGTLIVETFERGNKILICGNGGSAADAQHLAAEFVGRYEKERRAYPAIALTTDTSALTALANDYDFEHIFSRQVEAITNKGDCLIAISTSGNSRNVIAAVMTARSRGCKIIGLTGQSGKKLAALCDAVVMVPSERTARIQEAHIAVVHYWCEMLDSDIAK
jgi:D-sedoheptulose 7-phosphate isomerase